ncbi:hypothetical protein [Brevibacillus massiliensis]|uniref:hypothetical protein n=1 Tax=Brevibacillus massiliensis TaxID=1118054 RepID=UPI0002EC4DDD|nr:hypothetical protein [Brevibacillus massiliensis]
MAQQMDINTLKKAEAAAAVAKEMITQAITQSAANTMQAEEALRQASNEIAQVQMMVSQVQSAMQAQTMQQQQQQK